MNFIVCILSCVAAIIQLFALLMLIIPANNGNKTAIATCPHCSATNIRGYDFIRPREWSCPFCGIKVMYEKAKKGEV